MITVQVVAPNYVYQVWDTIEPWFSAAEMFGVGDCTTSQLKLQLVSGAQTLLVAVNESDVIGAAAMAVTSLPNERVAVISAAGGRGITNQEVLLQVEAWARAQGATKLRVWAKDSQARLYKQKLGLEPVTTVMEKGL
jgi:hypothetical protein